jgi:hypothetical protein
MTNRKTFYQFRQSRAPNVLGSCATDYARLSSYVNEATERLLKDAGEWGWWGTWQRTVFNVDPVDPYITIPREVARVQGLTVCKQAVRIRNEFYEFLEAGNGLQPSNACNCSGNTKFLETYDRGFFSTFKDLNSAGNPKQVRLYPTSTRDVGGVRVLVQGLDNNGHVIRGMDNAVNIEGEYMNLATPFVTSTNYFSSITGVQKDISAGDVLLYEVDSVTGAQVLLSRYQASEDNPSYRRYFLNGMPATCCDGASTVQVTCMAKLDYVPVSVDQDWLLIGNIPALKLECEAVRYEEMDNEKAQKMAESKHAKAVKLLNDELTHYLGRLSPIVNFAPFGTARLERIPIGMI